VVRFAWIRCDVNEYGPFTRRQLADALNLVPKTVQFHLTALAALGVVIPTTVVPMPRMFRRR
jgi:predicted ArsR family transcriptional regulator